MLARLIHQRVDEKFARLELRQCESVEPGLPAAGETADLGPRPIPELDVDAVRTALTEDEHRHDRAGYHGRSLGESLARIAAITAHSRADFTRKLDCRRGRRALRAGGPGRR